MAQTLTAKEQPLSKIFSDDYVFSIPGYQRPYSWGTEQARELLEDILDNQPRYNGFTLNDPSSDAEKIPVTAIREGEIKGYHEVNWNSGLEKISISHEAFDRRIFAEGAILAAGWLIDKKPGVYTMKDIIGL